MLNDTPVMEDFSISVNDTLKLLQNLKFGKAAGLDQLEPLLLKELKEEIAPIIQVIFERSIKTGKLPAVLVQDSSSPGLQEGDVVRLQLQAYFPDAYFARRSSIYWLHTWSSTLISITCKT